MTLTEIFNKYGTDKGTIGHGHEVHNYGPFYENLFEKIRNENITLCEIGILRGNSLRSWREYFPNATIIGVDNLPERLIQGENFTTLLGDSDKPLELAEKIREYGPFDIIIDDGSHLPHHQQKCLPVLFKLLKPGGYYIIEDLHTERLTSKEWGVQYFKNGDSNTTLEVFAKFICNKELKSYYIDDEDLKELLPEIDMIQLQFPKIGMIKKKANVILENS
jgi:hypothetical protein